MFRPAALLLALCASAAFPAAPARACTPCRQVLSFEETSAAADLIIIGESLDASVADRNQMGGPDTIRVKVVQPLVGSAEHEVITVNAWDGMCPYGFSINREPYVMFLSRKSGFYDSLNSGCSLKTLTVRENRILIDNRKVTVEEFRELLRGHRGRQQQE